MSHNPLTRIATIGLGLTLTLTLAGCGQSSAQRAQQSSTPSASASAAANFPSTVQSCDTTLTFSEAPKKVILIGEINAPILYELGVLNHVTGLAGEKRVPQEDPKMREALNAIKKLETTPNGGGGYFISTEAILAEQADLVIGYANGVDQDQLKAAGVPFYIPGSFCPENQKGEITYQAVNDEIDRVASMFGVQTNAEQMKKQFDKDLKGLPTAGEDQGSGAALFITPGSPDLWTYGSSSMVTPMFKINGLKNVYDDNPKRVFEVSVEDLLSKNPDWIVLLSSSSTDDEATKIFMGMNGVSQLKAVQNGHVIHVPYALVDPPSNLSIKGAQRLAELLKQKK